jgi:O-antigen ligase
LLLIVASTFYAVTNELRSDGMRWFWLLPAGLLALPVLQLVPLPHAFWSHLPGRAPLAAGLEAARVAVSPGAWTVSPIATEGVLWSALVPASVFMGASLLDEARRRALVLAALAFAAVSAFVGLWQLMEGPTSALYLYRITNQGEAVGLFANRNHLASLLAISLPVAAGALADRIRRRSHAIRDLQVWLLTALIVLLSVAVTATHSRAGFVLFMLGVLAGSVVLFRARDARRLARARRWLQLGAALAAILIVQLPLFGMLSRLDKDPLDEYRWTLVENTIQAAEPARGIGYGLGTFVQAYDEIGDATADTPSYVNHAHDDYVELWLEGGVVAMSLILATLAMLGWQVFLQWRGRRDGTAGVVESRGLEAGAAFALVLLALHSAVDYPLRTLTLATLASLLAAVLLGGARIQRRAGGAVAIPSQIH